MKSHVQHLDKEREKVESNEFYGNLMYMSADNETKR